MDCVTTVFVFGGCYLFDKAAVGQAYSRPGHGVSCQTRNYTAAATVMTSHEPPLGQREHSSDIVGNTETSVVGDANLGIVFARNLVLI